MSDGKCFLKSRVVQRQFDNDRISGSIAGPPPPRFPWQNTSLPVAQRVFDIIQRLDLPTKVEDLKWEKNDYWDTRKDNANEIGNKMHRQN